MEPEMPTVILLLPVTRYIHIHDQTLCRTVERSGKRYEYNENGAFPSGILTRSNQNSPRKNIFKMRGMHKEKCPE